MDKKIISIINQKDGASETATEFNFTALRKKNG